MTFEQLFTSKIQEIEPVFLDTLGQIIQQEVSLSKEISEAASIKSVVGQQRFPCIVVVFDSGTGQHMLRHVFLLESAFLLRIYGLMLGEEPAVEVDEDHFDGLKEIVNQLFGQIKTSVSGDKAAFTLNDLQAGQIQALEEIDEVLTDNPGIHSRVQFNLKEGSFSLDYLCWELYERSGALSGESNEMEDINNSSQLMANDSGDVNVQPVEFGNLSGNGKDYDMPRNVDMLMDVNLEVSVELDRKSILVSDLLKLGKGSIVELEKSAGEPLDIFVNGRKFAEGEVVVIDDKFGIRITQLLSPKERVKSLG